MHETSTTSVILDNLARHTSADLSEYESMDVRKRAAVLMPLVLDHVADTAHVILTRRALSLRTHPGEVAFAGGRMDPADVNGAATALRECDEEIGLAPQFITVKAFLHPAVSLHRLLVVPVAAIVDAEKFLKEKETESTQTTATTLAGRVIEHLRLSDDEVHSAFAVPLDTFLKRENYEAQEVDADGDSESGKVWRYHVFQVTDEFGRKYNVWGLTAHFCVEFARVALGREPEFPLIHYSERPQIVTAGTAEVSRRSAKEEYQ